VGIDKSNQRKELCWDVKKLLSIAIPNGNIMNNSPVAFLGGGYARDWWYDVYPNLMFYAVAYFLSK
jgi:hypothetical protein